MPVAVTALIEAFRERFSRDATHGLFSPGRVNLIGEHIDYCGGLVLPMAINLGTSAVFSATDSSMVRVYSSRFGELCSIDPHDVLTSKQGHWSDYVRGVFRVLGHRQMGAGFDIYINDNISAGGLSSSASFTIAIAIAAYQIVNGHDLQQEDQGQRLDTALKCQKVENDFVGVACGIMDQASILLGEVIQLNCKTLALERPAVDFGDYCLVVMNTMKTRELADVAYNDRVQETQQILTLLSERFGIRQLVDLDIHLLDDACKLLDQSLLIRRLRHVVSEQHRVISASKTLIDNNMDRLGILMNESHASLQDDFEVTGNELNLITSLSRSFDGVLGSRMTGAGFGGCAISLVHRDVVKEHAGYVLRQYEASTSLRPDIFEVKSSKGAMSWQLD